MFRVCVFSDFQIIKLIFMYLYTISKVVTNAWNNSEQTSEHRKNILKHITFIFQTWWCLYNLFLVLDTSITKCRLPWLESLFKTFDFGLFKHFIHYIQWHGHSFLLVVSTMTEVLGVGKQGVWIILFEIICNQWKLLKWPVACTSIPVIAMILRKKLWQLHSLHSVM